jgi:hypothetical protein
LGHRFTAVTLSYLFFVCSDKLICHVWGGLRIEE